MGPDEKAGNGGALWRADSLDVTSKTRAPKSWFDWRRR